MSTKTAYYARTNLTKPLKICEKEAKSVFALIRHGTRHSSHIAKMEALAERLAKAFVRAPLWLASWHYPEKDAEPA